MTRLLILACALLAGCAQTPEPTPAAPRIVYASIDAETARSDFSELRTEGAVILIDGMHCPSCSHSVQSIVGQLWCVETVRADVSSGRVFVSFDLGTTAPSPAFLAMSITRTGYRLVSITPTNDIP
jgi:copper chaperone CopZ